MSFFKATSKIVVTVNRGQRDEGKFTFDKPFRIGRDVSCDICLKESVVSAFHVDVAREGDTWWLRDVRSTNGTYLDGRIVDKVRLADRATVQLGKRGPLLSLKVETPISAQRLVAATLQGTMRRSLPASTQMLRNLLRKSLPQHAGNYTVQLRRAVDLAIKKKSRRLLLLLSAVSVIALGALGVAWFQHQQLENLRPVGVQIFYTMKTLELQIHGLIDLLADSSDPEVVREIAALREQYKSMQSDYNNYVEQLGLYGDDVSREDQLILQMARTFGECEINMPADFVSEVKNYVKKWQSSNRLSKSMRKCFTFGYSKVISEAFFAHNLPPQFLYLALQESGFDTEICGPKTRYGIAKGMWQFIPGTARAYGLKVGPLSRYPRHDPRDERHDFEKSTKAAARLIRDLYNTKAKGSGLLVLASYNWGIGNLNGVIEKMPDNPSERNFWNLVKNHKIPQQTYDFVFYIISAAVIGEYPELFGFKFKNLLADVS